jgi:hypothetical protein
MEVCQNLKIEHDLGIPLLGICLREYKSNYRTDTFPPMFIASLSNYS